MKKELNDAQVEEVVGGTVIISANYMRVGFVTTKESYKLNNVTYREARNYAEDLLDENRHLTSYANRKWLKKVGLISDFH